MKTVFPFKKIYILQFIRSTLNNFFNCHNRKGIKLVIKMLTGLSHLHENKFKYSFQSSLNTICRCDTDAKSCVHYFLHRRLFQIKRLIILSIVENIDSKWLYYIDLPLTQILLFGDTSLDVNTNPSIFRMHSFRMPIFPSTQLLIFTIFILSPLNWYFFRAYFFFTLFFGLTQVP